LTELMWEVLPQYMFTTQGNIQVESLNLNQIHIPMPYNVSRWWAKFFLRTFDVILTVHRR